MKKRKRKKLASYTKALCDCGRKVRVKIKKIIPPFFSNYWTECRCGNWVGESDLCGKGLRK